jgi:hypothetical protein
VGGILEEYMGLLDKQEAMECVQELQTKFPASAVSQEVT